MVLALENFDFDHEPMLSRARVAALAAGDAWLTRGENLLLFGPPGSGKTHISAAIGRALIEAGYRILFTRTTDLVQRLQTARQELTLEAAITKLDRYDLPHDSRKVIDIARNFGPLYVGGVLGVRLAILPWSEEDVFSALTTCFGRARHLIIDDAKLLHDGLKLLRAYLKNLPELEADGLGCDTIDGYHKRKKGVDVFTIKVDAFSRASPIVPQRTLVRNWLLQNGYLDVREIRGLNRTKQLQPREQWRWPDDERRRSFRIKPIPRLKVIS